MTREYKHDVAISYASEDRTPAEELANLLEDSGYAVFYDKHKVSEIWGKDLAEHFAVVFKDESRFCVMFVSEHYKEKAWTIHERRSAMVRALKERREYILPVQIDGADIPDIAGLAYLDLREMDVADIFKALEEKIVKDRELTEQAPVKAQAAIKAAQSRYAFARVDGKETVHPLVVYELIGGDYGIVDGVTTTSVNVDRANKSNRSSDMVHEMHDSTGHVKRIWMMCLNINGRSELFQYTHIGTSPSGTVILQCSYSGGGSGAFGTVGLFEWRTSDLSEDELDLVIVDVIALGDRYEGKVVYQGGVLYIHPDQSHWRNGPDSLIERRID